MNGNAEVREEAYRDLGDAVGKAYTALLLLYGDDILNAIEAFVEAASSGDPEVKKIVDQVVAIAKSSIADTK